MRIANLRYARIIVLTAFLGVSLSSCTKASAPEKPDTKDAVLNWDKLVREVWQLVEIDESAWTNMKPNYPDLSEDIKHSIITQFKLVTWSADGDFEFEAFWLDCNMPKLERRRRVIKPAHTIEHRDEDGGVSYTTTPAEYKPYIDIIRHSEGCPLLPPAENILAHHTEGSFHQLFNNARRVRDGEALTYRDADGHAVARFKLVSGI